MVSDCRNSVVFVIITFLKNQSFMQVFENFYTFFIKFWEIDDYKHCFIYIYILNKIVLNFKDFKLMAFLAFFIFLFSLLNANFIHTIIFYMLILILIL